MIPLTILKQQNMSTQNEVLDDINFSNNVKNFKEFNFPLNFEFKIGTMANDFVVKDANGTTIAYVRQKMFKLKEAIIVYANESKKDILYKINADRILDFRASYAFTNEDGEVFGRVGRKGMKSLWKAHYEIFDNDNNQEYSIGELNPWAKVLDGLLGEVPLLSMFTGYLFNPKYGLKSPDGKLVAQLTKEASLFGRRFKLEKLADLETGDSERMILSLMMMLLLERRRG